jgi:parallel beta-helix repeat protein
MNDDRYLERDVASVFAETAPSREPDDLLENVFLTTGPMRPRPRWLARIKEPPMRYTNSVAVGSPTARIVAIMVATLLITLMVAGAGVAGSRLLAADGTIVVDQSGGGDYTTITEAVAVAEDGDTILVRPGTYDESIVLTRDITIRGDGDRDAIVVELSVETPAFVPDDAPDLPFAFLFDGSESTLENLTVRGESSRIVISGGAPQLRDLMIDGIGRVNELDPGPGSVPVGLVITNGSAATIADNVIFDTEVGIDEASTPSITGSDLTIGAIIIDGVGTDPIIRNSTLADSVFEAVSIRDGARPLIEANTIVNAPTAVDVRSEDLEAQDVRSHPIVRDNLISGATLVGISVSYGSSATIEGNEISGNRTGIWVTDADASVVGNTLLDNDAGINLAPTDATVEGNSIAGGKTGITIAGGGSPRLTGNTVTGASITGITIATGTSPVLVDNMVCDNATNVFVADEPVLEGNEICAD